MGGGEEGEEAARFVVVDPTGGEGDPPSQPPTSSPPGSADPGIGRLIAIIAAILLIVGGIGTATFLALGQGDGEELLVGFSRDGVPQDCMSQAEWDDAREKRFPWLSGSDPGATGPLGVLSPSAWTNATASYGPDLRLDHPPFDRHGLVAADDRYAELPSDEWNDLLGPYAEPGVMLHDVKAPGAPPVSEGEPAETMIFGHAHVQGMGVGEVRLYGEVSLDRLSLGPMSTAFEPVPEGVNVLPETSAVTLYRAAWGEDSPLRGWQDVLPGEPIRVEDAARASIVFDELEEEVGLPLTIEPRQWTFVRGNLTAASVDIASASLDVNAVDDGLELSLEGSQLSGDPIESLTLVNASASIAGDTIATDEGAAVARAEAGSDSILAEPVLEHAWRDDGPQPEGEPTGRWLLLSETGRHRAAVLEDVRVTGVDAEMVPLQTDLRNYDTADLVEVPEQAYATTMEILTPGADVRQACPYEIRGSSFPVPGLIGPGQTRAVFVPYLGDVADATLHLEGPVIGNLTIDLSRPNS